MNTPKIIEVNNQRLLTTEQLAEFYETDSNVIRKNFNRNKNKFIQDKHYVLIEGDELAELKNSKSNSHAVKKNARYAYLWTKKGVMRHTKMLGTDKAWDMFDVLEESYFSAVVTQQIIPSQLSYREQALLALAANEETNERVDKVESDVKYLIEEVRLDASRYDSLGRFINTKIRQVISERALTPKVQKPFRQDLNRSVNTICGVRTRNQIKDRDYEKAIKVVEDWQPSTLAIHEARQLQLTIEQEQLGEIA